MRWLALALALLQGPDLAAWREALELDLAGEVLEAGLARVRGGDLAADDEARALVARALDMRGRSDEGLALLAEGAGPHAELARARLRLARDELEEALAILAPAEAGPRRSELPESWFLCGRALARRGDETAARPFLERHVALDPYGPDAAAARNLLSAEALGRGDREAGLGWARAAAEVGRWRGLLRARRLQVRAAPEAALPRLGLARLWLEVQDDGRALPWLEDAARLDPRLLDAWMLLADASRRAVRLARAEEAYGAALGLRPELALARLNRALARIALARDGDARADLEILLSGPAAEDPRFVAAHLALARILARAGQAEAARARHARYVALGGSQPLEEPD